MPPFPDDSTRRPGSRGILHVIHGHGGGTEHHARSLIDAARPVCRNYLAVAVGDAWQVEEHLNSPARKFEVVRERDETWPAFIGGVCATFGIDLMHLHNISGCRDGIIEALEALGVPYGYTAHDLNFACPTILFLGADGNYCFEQTDAAICGKCLRAQAPFAHIDIEAWRSRHGALLAGAAFLIAPSRWAASALARYYPGLAMEVIAHGAPGVWAPRSEGSAPMPPAEPSPTLPGDGVPTVAVLGAVGPDKGARRLERMAELVRAGHLRVRFVLIGYMDVEHGPWQSADAVLTIHGRYDPRDLPALLAHYRVQLVAFPSAGPETFSLTLSEAWAAGLPVIVPPFGALAERVGATGAGWVWTEEEWRDEARMLARITDLVTASRAEALAAAAARARQVLQPTLADMAARTVALYRRVENTRRRSVAPLDPARVCHALDGMPGQPPASDGDFAAARAPSIAPANPDAISAQTAPRPSWQSLPRRILARLVPPGVRSAVKSRLR